MPPAILVPGGDSILCPSPPPQFYIHLSSKFQSLKVLRNLVSLKSRKTLTFSKTSQLQIAPCCSKGDILSEISNIHLDKDNESENDEIVEIELLHKPVQQIVKGGGLVEEEVAEQPLKVDKEETLAPFLKFFKPRDSLEDLENEIAEEATRKVVDRPAGQEKEGVGEGKKVLVEYFEPKAGDFVVGVVVSGNENRLDVNVGADLLGTMLTKEVLPLYDKEMDYLTFDMEKNAEEFMMKGKMGVVSYDDIVNCWVISSRPVLEVGNVVFAEVLGRTLSGRPLLSMRRLFRRLAWHRARLSSLRNL